MGRTTFRHLIALKAGHLAARFLQRHVGISANHEAFSLPANLHDKGLAPALANPYTQPGWLINDLLPLRWRGKPLKL